MALQPGSRLGPYEVQAPLGQGGMGTVYRAFDTTLQRSVAIKVLSEADEQARGKLLAEARAASALDHPNICTVYEVGEADGQPYIVMALVEGKPLSEVIPSNGLPAETVIHYGLQIADALAQAHEKGIVHRDLKSQNVVITPEGRAKVLDFGLAMRLERPDAEALTVSMNTRVAPASIVGTLAYMAPEVVALTEDIPGSHRFPVWTSDGTRVAFRRAGEQEWFSVPALGGPPRRLPWLGSWLTWSPDGEAVAFVSGEAVFVAPAEGGEPRKVADVRRPPLLSWSPDGTQLAFSSGNRTYLGDDRPLLNLAQSSIRVIAASDGTLVQATDGAHFDFGPAWSADGSSLFFVSDRGGSRDIYRLDLLSSEAPARLTTGLNVFTMTPSYDGRRLAYSVITSSQNLRSLPIPTEGSLSVTEAEPVTTGNQAIEGVDVSPDGRWLAFDSTRSGNQDIYTMPRGGGEPIQLTTDPAMDCCPSWSPDASEVAFHSFRTGNRDIFVVSADGGTPVQITNDVAQDRYPSWSPDGRDIVFGADDRTTDHAFYRVSREQGEVGGETPRELTSDGGSFGRATWSPDGRFLAYGGEDGVRVVPSAGGTPRRVSSEGNMPLWAPDGNTIYFRTATGIWSVPASGGDPRQLARFDDPNRVGIRVEWSSDGEHFYFALTEYESDVWVMELEQDDR